MGTVVFDGCPLFENAPVLSWMMTQMYVKKQRKAKKVPELARRRMTALYGPVFGPAMAKSFVTMSENSLRAIVASCSECEFVSYPKELEKRMFFEYGEKDFDCRTGKKNLAKHYPAATVTVRKGYGHCQYMSSLGEHYGKVLEDYMTR